jgi:DNA-binding ferritin-like protein (Dps family)
MADVMVNVPPTKQPGQKSLDISDAYLARILPVWSRPYLVDGNTWRKIVKAQPIAELFRDTLIMGVTGLDWKISARDSDQQDELRGTIRHYSNLLEKGGHSGIDHVGHVEWVCKDLLDIPFGGAAEIGRKNDAPNGRVAWFEPLDGATLYPTLNKEMPVIQDYNAQQVAFPAHAIARVMMSPRTDIQYKGWAVAPPEIVYTALQMISRGDSYYANLLLDIPPAGILDLGDMERNSALEWVEAYKGFLANGGNTSFKIPVLYEHNNEIKFVPFGKVPNDIMYDRITLRYMAIIGASYGMTLSDIGIQSTSASGETLAGAIRNERKTRMTGKAKLKKKLKYYFEQILPPSLRFDWVDYDDELNVAVARARLANATAMKQFQDSKNITPEEARKQLITDGMFTISMPEQIPDDYEWNTDTVSEKSPERPRMLGDPLPASIGGEGEIRRSELMVKASRIVEENYDVFKQIADENQDDPIWAAQEIDQYTMMKSDVVEQAGMIILRDILLDTENTIDYNDVIDMVGEDLVRCYDEITKGETE